MYVQEHEVRGVAARAASSVVMAGLWLACLVLAACSDGTWHLSTHNGEPGTGGATVGYGDAAGIVTVLPQVVGTTPGVLGYNLGHFATGSNAADWFRYSGAKAARVFVSASHIEPSDDLGTVGDGVTDLASFASRKAALRAHVVADATLSGSTYVAWSAIKPRYAVVDGTSNNTMAFDTAFAALRAQGVAILANITCSPSRFPLAGAADWPNAWEIWQHYYAQATYLGRTYDVARYGTFNEPNGWTPAITVEDWHLRMRIASDAIQAAIADVNTATGKSLVAQVFAPNTANGATKYDDYLAGDYWGQLAVQNRHLKLDGTTAPDWWNFHVYNYQKYSTLQYDTSTSSGYIDDQDALRAKILADTVGEAPLPIALTEFNSRTALSYDGRTNTADTPADYAALGASLVALANSDQLYLFKFGMTERTGTYPVGKNGTHYVDNASALRSYGGAASTAEVYRLFLKAAGAGRTRYATRGPVDVWSLATTSQGGQQAHVFVANKTTAAVGVDIDVVALGVPDGSSFVVEEVSTTCKGGVVRTGTVAAGRVPLATMPAESVWLVTLLPTVNTVTPVLAVADTMLADGTGSPGRTTTGGTVTSLQVRANGTVNGRRVALLRIPTSGLLGADTKAVLLSLRAATISQATNVQAHVYGLEDDSWSESSATFASLTSALKQGVGAGNEIVHNVVEDARVRTRMLGQLWVGSTTVGEKLLDVTNFVRAQADGFASFLVVQEHRWTASNHLGSGTGDTQVDGIRILSRENNGSQPRLLAYRSVVATAAPVFTPPAGTYTSAQSVAMASATPGASIRYTTNGTVPTATSGTLYTAPVAVASSQVLQAIAYASGYANSAVTSASYVLQLPPPAPTSLVASVPRQSGRIALSWRASTGATSYTVKRSTVSGGPYTVVASGLTGTSYTNTGLTSRTTYFYVVTAVNAFGESAPSNQASATAR